jgi:hypothetical protein
VLPKGRVLPDELPELEEDRIVELPERRIVVAPLPQVVEPSERITWPRPPSVVVTGVPRP